MNNSAPISIIIPARDADGTLAFTLASIAIQSAAPSEIIIVDDGSTVPLAIPVNDPGMPDPHRIRVIRLDQSRGPAVARNAGAAVARSDILLFIDADVVLAPDVVRLTAAHFDTVTGIAAVQGIYDSRTPDTASICTRYQNHYYHHAFMRIATPDASVCATFCFAVRRPVFDQMGGFDAAIARPTVEDEAFGYRLTAAGHRIYLDRSIRVMHLAHYTVSDLILRKFRMSFHQVKSLLRGIRPPVGMPRTTNRSHHARDTLAAIILAPFLPAAVFAAGPAAWIVLLVYFALNARFWGYLWKNEPPACAMEMIGLTWVDQTVICSGLFIGSLDFLTGNRY
ncbi:glycosyltransferase family 2 protein [bacterium]|nr:glycosyltransferase family 2 protein [candidate division CSSED10-310 bacterium]